MILVDSSVWIDFFSPSPGRAGAELHRSINEGDPLALTGVVVAEVLQGLTKDSRYIERFLADFDLIEPSGFETYKEAASIFRKGRSKGYSLTTIDTLIAAVAIEHNTTVFTRDQDFSRIALIAPLQLHAY